MYLHYAHVLTDALGGRREVGVEVRVGVGVELEGRYVCLKGEKVVRFRRGGVRLE